MDNLLITFFIFILLPIPIILLFLYNIKNGYTSSSIISIIVFYVLIKILNVFKIQFITNLIIFLTEIFVIDYIIFFLIILILICSILFYFNCNIKLNSSYKFFYDHSLSRTNTPGSINPTYYCNNEYFDTASMITILYIFIIIYIIEQKLFLIDILKEKIEKLKNNFDIYNLSSSNSFLKEFKYDQKENDPIFVLYSTIFFLIISGCFFYYTTTSPQILTNNLFTISIISVLPILIALYFLLKMSSFKINDNFKIILGICIFIAVTLFTIYMRDLGISKFIKISYNYTFFIFFIIIIIVGLALLFNIFKQYLIRQQGILGFFINFIFYIPCLLVDLIEFIKK
jgi:hypothetical protein